MGNPANGVEMSRTRRTKKRYTDLFVNPKALFDGVETVLWPNGEPEIWFKADNGRLRISVRASLGPAGLSVLVRKHVATDELTASGNHSDGSPITIDDVWELSLTQYRQTPAAQAFKAWYQSAPDDPRREQLRVEYETLLAKERAS